MQRSINFSLANHHLKSSYLIEIKLSMAGVHICIQEAESYASSYTSFAAPVRYKSWEENPPSKLYSLLSRNNQAPETLNQNAIASRQL